jgi:tyrosyl-tRNA synthetase
VLRRLRLFQDCGHVAVLILGDFTAKVGDPSGKSATRPQLSKEAVDAHAETYVAQIGEILDTDPARLEIRRNSEWLAPLGMDGVLRLTAQATVARMLERDDFAKRYAEGVPITIMEFLYPLLQGLDSVEINADVELGGTDQLFNILMGRHLQEKAGHEPQVVVTTPLLVGLDGEQKMSKSLGNYVGVAEPGNEQFGKLMKISDDLLPMYLTHATAWGPDEIDRTVGALADGSLHPNVAKRLLARTVVDLYHGAGAGAAAETEFDRVFKAHEQPSEMPEFSFASGISFSRALLEAGLVGSNREAAREIGYGSVKCDGSKVTDGALAVPDGEHVLQHGRRKWAKVRVE